MMDRLANLGHKTCFRALLLVQMLLFSSSKVQCKIYKSGYVQ
jgi:hypothetical protein